MAQIHGGATMWNMRPIEQTQSESMHRMARALVLNRRPHIDAGDVDAAVVAVLLDALERALGGVSVASLLAQRD